MNGDAGARATQIWARLHPILRRYAFLLKASFSALLLFLVFRGVDLGELVAGLARIDLMYVPAITALLFANLVLMSAKWNIFLERRNRLPVLERIRIYWAGDFVGLFSLGAVGNEAYKALSNEHRRAALASSLMDRGVSFFWYAQVGIVFVVLWAFDLNRLLSVPALAVLFWVWVELFYVVYGPLTRTRVRRIIQFADVGKRNLLVHAVFCTAIIVATASTFFLAFRAVGLSTNFVVLLFFSPVFIVLTILPISVQGIGLREVIYVQVGTFFGIGPVNSLLASFTSYFASLIYKLSGTIPFMIGRRRR